MARLFDGVGRVFGSIFIFFSDMMTILARSAALRHDPGACSPEEKQEVPFFGGESYKASKSAWCVGGPGVIEYCTTIVTGCASTCRLLL